MRLLFEQPPRPLLKSVLECLFRYGTHQTSSGRLEQVYLLSDRRLEWFGRAIIRVGLERMSGDQNVGTIRVTHWAIIYVRPGALGQILHQCKSLSYVAEYVYQIC